jgi:hypothetical protein
MFFTPGGFLDCDFFGEVIFFFTAPPYSSLFTL